MKAQDRQNNSAFDSLIVYATDHITSCPKKGAQTNALLFSRRRSGDWALVQSKMTMNIKGFLIGLDISS